MTLFGIPLRNTIGRQWCGEHTGIHVHAETDRAGNLSATLSMPSGRSETVYGASIADVERNLRLVLRENAREATETLTTLDRLMAERSAA